MHQAMRQPTAPPLPEGPEHNIPLAIPGLTNILKTYYNYNLLGNNKGYNRPHPFRRPRRHELNTPVIDRQLFLDRPWQPFDPSRLIPDHPTDDEYRLQARLLGMYWDRQYQALHRWYNNTNNRIKFHEYPLPRLRKRGTVGGGAMDIVEGTETPSEYIQQTSLYQQRKHKYLQEVHRNLYTFLHPYRSLFNPEQYGLWESDRAYVDFLLELYLPQTVYSWLCNLLIVATQTRIGYTLAHFIIAPAVTIDYLISPYRDTTAGKITEYVIDTVKTTYNTCIETTQNAARWSYKTTTKALYNILYYLVYCPVRYGAVEPIYKHLYKPYVPTLISDAKTFMNKMWLIHFRPLWRRVDPYIRWQIVNFIDDVKETLEDVWEDPEGAFLYAFDWVLELPFSITDFIHAAVMAVRHGLWQFFIWPFTKHNLYEGETYRIWWRRLARVMHVFGQHRATAVFGTSVACTVALMLIMNKGRL